MASNDISNAIIVNMLTVDEAALLAVLLELELLPELPAAEAALYSATDHDSHRPKHVKMKFHPQAALIL